MMSSDNKDAKMAINGPVFFLIQQQAKSTVAIQALQSRMAVLESIQERLMRAIDDVHQHLAPSKDAKNCTNLLKNPNSIIHAKLSPENNSASDKKLKFVDTETSNSRSDTSKAELSKSDSFNKDSGIGASESSLVNTDPSKDTEDEDELLQLLEIIDQKSLVLLQQVEGAESSEKAKLIPEMDEQSSAMLLDNLLFEKVDTQRQLSEVKAERDELRRRLVKLELATEAVTKEKVRVQQQLDATLLENQKLQEKIQNTGESKFKTESIGYLADIERANIKRKYLQYSEKSRRKVSSILKETNVLELQKQLLTYVMENDVLRAKLQQDEPSRMANWLKIESRLRKELKEALDSKQNLQEKLQAKDLEIASLKDRIRALEELVESDSCVKNFGMGSTEDWREPGVANVYNKRSNLNTVSPFSPLGYGDFSKTQSLPAMLLLESQQAKLKEQESEREAFGHVFDTGSFTEIPLDQSFQSEKNANNFSQHIDNTKDLVDLSSPIGPNYSSTSTLMQPQYLYQPTLHSGLSAPNLSVRGSNSHLQNWGFAPRKSTTVTLDNGDNEGGAKLVNGHLCWKGGSRLPIPNGHLTTSRDMSSICTEFDPLSDDSPSCENFVDSLNLSIPLKPTQVAISQLSSIGDSLHSTSLDLGCNSSPVPPHDNRKIHNARSVDGIRELLLENGYCKRPSSSLYGNSSVAPVILGKSGCHRPVNLMNCMHESSDYSLL
ncbi:ELKS/Rab6-interacting/CAST family member 1-like isoform X2 [Stegodyphus dumicola]|nr:ELKS/Rab6-interacting/CAST family member 1-like isoform X2 [Stegodyphus dumicola]XP_035217394.1 ELKS/Rab6-interacting/CAST family member 1-like isoform X2 [Stegodyphus dumicola]XP_035217395.1 ELKS/Rab6-interacting/CAST family member 1-like isoform X2 [Stegodyphus dumicola]XP_035217396.1 ELKS/Rab6-interacting/CAST family member 1-like isoform X2 [Stegodyphus dumicola]